MTIPEYGLTQADFREIQHVTWQIHHLLAEPEWGLLTWNEMLRDRFHELSALLRKGGF